MTDALRGEHHDALGSQTYALECHVKVLHLVL